MKGSLVAVGWVVFALTAYSQVPIASAAERSNERTAVLIDTDWLATHISDESVRVIEIGKRDSYASGHLPHSFFVDWIVDITDHELPERYNILPRERFEDLMGRLGVTPTTTLVLYDKFESRLSTRMFWTLRYYGHQPIKILDGGARAWVESGRPLSAEVPTVRPTVYEVELVEPKLRAKRQFIRNRLDRTRLVLIDGRPSEQYTGEEPGAVYHTGTQHARLGHIPEAINVPWKQNLTPDGRFKSVNELRKIYISRSVINGPTIVTYCNEGLHAAHPWFVLTELLGYDNVRLYDDSLSEWANTTDEPMIVKKPTSQQQR